MFDCLLNNLNLKKFGSSGKNTLAEVGYTSVLKGLCPVGILLISADKNII